MARKVTTINFNYTGSIVIYDIDSDLITNEKIIESNPYFDNKVSIVYKTTYNLPHNVLRTHLDKDECEVQFTKTIKKLDKNASIKRLFIVEVMGKNGIIKNNERI